MTNTTHKTDTVPNPMENAMSNAKNSLHMLKQTGIGGITRPMTNTTHKTGTAGPVPNPMENAMSNTKNTVLNSLRMLKQTGIEEITRKQWLAIRKMAALQIDPDTAEVMWVYGDPLIYTCGGAGRPSREIYARSPGSKEWVRYEDLSIPIRAALLKKHGWQNNSTHAHLDQ